MAPSPQSVPPNRGKRGTAHEYSTECASRSTPSIRGAKGTAHEYCTECAIPTSRDETGACIPCKRKNPPPVEVVVGALSDPTSDEAVFVASRRAGQRLRDVENKRLASKKPESKSEPEFVNVKTTNGGNLRIFVPLGPNEK